MGSELGEVALLWIRWQMSLDKSILKDLMRSFGLFSTLANRAWYIMYVPYEKYFSGSVAPD